MWASNLLSSELLLAMLLWLGYLSLLFFASCGLWWCSGAGMRLCMTASGMCWRRARIAIAEVRFRWGAYWLRRDLTVALLRASEDLLGAA